MPQQIIDLSNKRIGRWLVISIVPKILRNNKNKIEWYCKCDCGKVVAVRGDTLRRGETKSCGCLVRELIIKSVTVHGHNKNDRQTRTYNSWSSMIQRCTNPKAKSYKEYGARGIKVCSRWLAGFKYFLEDMGERPDNLTLDRIDNDGNYEPLNCKWNTLSEQNKNKRRFNNNQY